jgi:hypothetical protein
MNSPVPTVARHSKVPAPIAAGNFTKDLSGFVLPVAKIFWKSSKKGLVKSVDVPSIIPGWKAKRYPFAPKDVCRFSFSNGSRPVISVEQDSRLNRESITNWSVFNSYLMGLLNWTFVLKPVWRRTRQN